MAKYQIEATIEKIEVDTTGIKIQLRGTGKYIFEKENEKNNKKEYWNIFEGLNETKKENFTQFFKEKSDKDFIIFSEKLKELQPLFNQVFLEKKKLKFEINNDSNNEIFIITGISHVSS